jgi:hypothetical protein
VCHRKHPRRLDEVEPAGSGEAEHAVVPLPDVVVGPEERLLRLCGRSGSAVGSTQILDLVEVVDLRLAREGTRRTGAELRSAVEGQRANARQAKAENRRRQFNKPKGVDVGTDRYVIIGLALQKVRVDFVTSFPGGTVHAHGEGKRPSKPEVPIVGGTGLYAGATGSIEGQHLANGEKLNIYRLRVP